MPYDIDPNPNPALFEEVSEAEAESRSFGLPCIGGGGGGGLNVYDYGENHTTIVRIARCADGRVKAYRAKSDIPQRA